MKKIEAIQIADEIISLYKMYGNQDYIGEPVSQIEHMCQCAQFAEKENYDEEVILAAFFHDIGHLCEHVMEVDYMEDYGVVDHEKIGSNYLKSKGFSKKITQLVASHVEAKRYLTFKDPIYYKRLSDASKATLNFQGGPMDESEAKDFEKDEWFQLYITLRAWDEKAKEEHIPLPDLERYKFIIIEHLLQNKK
ncbi:MAG: HDIG domain-containing protein [Bacteroidota bacterium]|nr:HDIG domain-containing protein [Bacteroidota bacterium]